MFQIPKRQEVLIPFAFKSINKYDHKFYDGNESKDFSIVAVCIVYFAESPRIYTRSFPNQKRPQEKDKEEIDDRSRNK